MIAGIRVSDRLVISSLYFLYFGIMGIFLPYFNLYLYHLDFSGIQIGILSSMRSLTLIVFPMMWAVIADRFHLRRRIFIFCNIVSTGVFALLLFTADFWAMLVILGVYGMFYSPIISFMEAFTMGILGEDRNSYGRIRVFGTISFIIVVIVVGRIIDATSVELVVLLILAGSVIRVLASFAVPPVETETKAHFLIQAKSFLNLDAIVFLICAFLMLASHGAYYGFFSIHLEGLNLSGTFIGFSWALAAASEIAVMVYSHRIFKKFKIQHVLVFSMAVAAIRWFTLSVITSPVAVLFSQLFHSITYGAFHIASILYIDDLSPPEAKTFGQAINNALTYGLGLTAGLFVSGQLFEIMGTFFLFVVSGSMALTGGLILLVKFIHN